MPAGREQRAVAAVVGPAGEQLDRIELGAEELEAGAGVLDERVAVVEHPVLRLLRTAGRREQLRVLERQSERHLLVLGDRVTVVDRRA